MKKYDLLIKNAQLASFQENGCEYGMLSDNAIACVDGKVAWLGSTVQANQLSATQVVDVGGQVVTPALIDCHSHLVFAGSRANEFAMRLNGVDYREIAAAGGGILSTVKATRAADEQTLLELALPRLAALEAQGVMTVEIKSGYGLDLKNELKMLKVARLLAEQTNIEIQTSLLAAHATPPEYADNPDAYIELICQQIIPAAAQQGLADAVDGFCEGIAFSVEQIRKVFDAASRWNLPVKLHADQLSDLGGAELVAEYGGLSADHVEYSSLKSVKKMAHSDTVAVLLPYAFYTLQETQKPPIAAFRKHGVTMAVATDCNPGTAPSTNLQQCLHMACCQFGLTVEEAIAGVTCNAAKALGIEQRQGKLAIGQQAKMLWWDCEDIADLVYWQGGNKIKQKFNPA